VLHRVRVHGHLLRPHLPAEAAGPEDMSEISRQPVGDVDGTRGEARQAPAKGSGLANRA
jgi:hypothetical protein